jgi:hypothetical protein
MPRKKIATKPSTRKRKVPEPEADPATAAEEAFTAYASEGGINDGILHDHAVKRHFVTGFQRGFALAKET